ncbi:ribosomal biogenesis protein LAS1L isoform X2 [Sminthopsis crassicaudata]|uniref:ribosomal biogenesis protein LAS1L isoform X2 n=1 Tax=Sminthopsis crassicaudata TaxID=9301 RepID=UPI003D699807
MLTASAMASRQEEEEEEPSTSGTQQDAVPGPSPKGTPWKRKRKPLPTPPPAEPKVESVQVTNRSVVAWRSKAEWEQVMVYLFCSDPELQRHALNRVSAWKGRCSNNLPLAVACTTDLVLCKLLDGTSSLGTQELVLLYGMALVRFVNLITEPKQKIINIPLRRLAHEMHIPEWVVNLRHSLTHRNLPRLTTCRRGDIFPFGRSGAGLGGCEFVLEWLRRTYWCRQLGNDLGEPWDSGVSIREIEMAKSEDGERVVELEEEEEEEEEDVEELPREAPLSTEARRQRNVHEKIRKLLVSYGEQQFKVIRRSRQLPKSMKLWTKSTREVERLVGRLKKLAKENRNYMMDTLLDEGFLIPTIEQLEALKIQPIEVVNLVSLLMPRAFSTFWQPLLKGLQSQSFMQTLLEKMLRALPVCGETGIRPAYLICWINELVVLYTTPGPCQKRLTLGQRSVRKSWKLGPRKFTYNWSQLLDVCLDATCWATPHLVQLVLKAMEPQLPLESQQNLLCLCTIYTQGGNPATAAPSCEGEDPHNRPVYTLENLKWQIKRNYMREKKKNRKPGEEDEDDEDDEEEPEEIESEDSSEPEVMEVDPEPEQEILLKETPEMLAEKQAGLEGSPWQLCLDDINWSDFPLGKVPGQGDEPDELMLENYTLISVMDQPVIQGLDDEAHSSTFGSMGIKAESADGGSYPSLGFGTTSEVGQETSLSTMPVLQSEATEEIHTSVANQFPDLGERGENTISSTQVSCYTVEDDSDDSDVIIECHIPAPPRAEGSGQSNRVPVIVNPQIPTNRARYPLCPPTFIFPPIQCDSDDSL